MAWINPEQIISDDKIVPLQVGSKNPENRRRGTTRYVLPSESPFIMEMCFGKG